MTETLTQEQAINQRYNRLTKLLLTGMFLTAGLGMSAFIGFHIQAANRPKNPYNTLPMVVEYAETQQRLRDGFCLRRL